MKTKAFSILFAVLICVSLAVGQVGTLPLPTKVYGGYSHQSADNLIGGEHTACLWQDLFTWGGDSTARLNGSDTLRTPWILNGYTPTANESQNRSITYLNPQVFELLLRLKVYGAGDSIRILKMYSQSAMDTTLAPITNADSSNVFMYSGAYSSDSYAGAGGWLYEYLQTADDSVGLAMKLRFEFGGWKRFFIISTATDTVTVDGTLWGEN